MVKRKLTQEAHINTIGKNASEGTKSPNKLH